MNKHNLLNCSKGLDSVLKNIESILDGYDGIDGNKNYVKYCYNKAVESRKYRSTLGEILDNAYHINVSKRKEINITQLLNIIKKQFSLLDDIDTAGDIFRPKWCVITSTVESLQKLRWLYAYIDSDSNELDSNGFIKDNRVLLKF